MANKKFLDLTGISHLWGKVETALNNKADISDLQTLESDIKLVKNLETPNTVFGGDFSGSVLITNNVNVPAGKYTLEIDKVVSSDTDTELSAIVFMYVNGGATLVKVPRMTGYKNEVELTDDVNIIYLYASDGYANSLGDTLSFTGLKLFKNYPLRQEIQNISKNLQNLSGTSLTYEEGNRTFQDKTFVYVNGTKVITSTGSALTDQYSTYIYQIKESTSFMVTGHTRGGSNHLAIVTDSDGTVLDAIELGKSGTNTYYDHFIFSVNDPAAATVYICLHTSTTDEVKIGVTKDTRELSILFLGNSLTQDGIAYLPYLLTKYYPGFKFRFYIWYNGGYILQWHYTKFIENRACEQFSIAENSPSWTTTTATMADVLSTYKFNIVCMQEYFNRKTTYTEADLVDWNNCRDYITSNYKGGNALEFISLFPSPWTMNGDEEMNTIYELTKTANALILQKTIADDMIATGLALQLARSTDLDSLGDEGHLTPDFVHAQEGLPCLLEAYTALLWVLDRYGYPTSLYGLPFKMTAGIQSSIAVPGANPGNGVIEGTDAQNLLAQEVAIKAYKMGKKFVADNIAVY